MIKLETERLKLEKWSKKDAEGLFAYAKNPNVGPNAGWKPHENIKESMTIIKKIFLTNIVWKITLKENNQIIGSIGLEADRHRPGIASKELGYSLAEDHWGKGIMTEAAKAVLDYAFNDMGLEIVAVQTGPLNLRSQRVIEKLGFKSEGLQRYAYIIYDGSVRDVKVYSMYKDEWE